MSTHGAHLCLQRPLASVELMVHLGRRYTLKFLGIHQYDGNHGLPVAVVWVVHSCMFPGCICCCYTQPFCACTMGRCCVCILGRDVLAPWGGVRAPKTHRWCMHQTSFSADHCFSAFVIKPMSFPPTGLHKRGFGACTNRRFSACTGVWFSACWGGTLCKAGSAPSAQP